MCRRRSARGVPKRWRVSRRGRHPVLSSWDVPVPPTRSWPDSAPRASSTRSRVRTGRRRRTMRLLRPRSTRVGSTAPPSSAADLQVVRSSPSTDSCRTSSFSYAAFVRVILVRHCQSDLNAATHPTTWGLTPEGRRQAAALASSPWLRAASVLAAGPEPKMIETLGVGNDRATLGADSLQP